MKPILVPTDFSDCAQFAQQAALALAQKLECEVQFIHIIETPFDWTKLEQSKEELYPETKKKVSHAHYEMNKLIEQADKMGIKAHPFIYFNETLTDLMHTLSKHEHELIVMGTHGERKFPGNYLGSHTQKALRYASKPVLVIKNDFKLNEIHNVLLAYDLSDKAEKAIHPLMPLFKKLELNVHLLYINTPYRFVDTFTSLKKMKLISENHPSLVKSENILNYHKQEEGILEYRKLRPFELICVIMHSRTEIARAVMGSLAEDIVLHSELPILVLNDVAANN